METTQNTYRPGQPIEAQFGPSGWSPATYAAFRHGQHLIRTEAGDVLPAHPDKIRATAPGWHRESPSIWQLRDAAGRQLAEVNEAAPGIFTPTTTPRAGQYGVVGRNVATLTEAQQIVQGLIYRARTTAWDEAHPGAICC